MADSKKYDGSQWEHSLRKLATATEAVENPLYSDGAAITSYTIKGNTVQNGTPTPTNPVDAVGVGTLDSGQYKIPILSGGVTTNIYLGSTQTTRQIKKLVFTGDESWQVSSAWKKTNTSVFFYYQMDMINAASTSKIYVISDKFEATSRDGLYNGDSDMIAKTGGYAMTIRVSDSIATTTQAFKAWLASNPVTVWYILETPETGVVNEPLMKIGNYADTLSNAASIPTTEGANSITVGTTVQPSEFTATWTGWHNASVKEYEGGVGNNKFDEQYPDISTTTAYRPIYVGDGTFTMSSTVGREGTSAALYFLAGNVSTGAHNSTNSVYDGQNRTQTAVDGYVTVAYRRIETLSPENYSTMLSKGSTALPYEPYEYGWE